MGKVFDYFWFALLVMLISIFSLLSKLFGHHVPLLHCIVILYPIMPFNTDVSKSLIHISSFLIRMGSNVNSQDCDRRTPLHYAVRSDECIPVAKFLIEKGASLEARDNCESTPLLWASYYGCDASLELLILNGADVKVRNYIGFSALHNAAGHRQDSCQLTDITELLIASGASIYTLDNSGATPLNIAVNRGKNVVERLLRANNIKSGEIYSSRATEKLSLGDFRGAEIDCTKAIQTNPKHAVFFVNRSIARSFMEDHHGAIKDANISIELDPSFATAWENRGIIHLSMGYTKEAIADLDKSIEINPKSGVSFYNRGIALNKVGEKQAAIADLEEAAILYKNNGEMQSYQQALRELDNIQKSQ